MLNLPSRAHAFFAVLALLATAACSSPSGLSETEGPAASLSATDRTFISQAAYGSFGEIALGEIATERASSPAVREFGQMMVQEHTRMNEELAAIASQKGVTPPTAPDPGRQAVGAQLSQLQGSAFDRQYIQQQLADHETTLTLFEGEVESGRDPQLRAFAQKYAPVVQEHIAMLRRLEAQVVASR
jgi:putative membrane protein